MNAQRTKGADRGHGSRASIGIVGAGAITRNSHLPVLSNIPDVTVAWVYDRVPQAATAVADAWGVSAATATSPEELPPCDIALLAIPVTARASYHQEFANRGTALVCEKPFAATGHEHARLLTLYAPHALGAAYMRRFYRWAIIMRKLVRELPFGALQWMRVSEGNRSKGSGSERSFLDDTSMGRLAGVLTDLGSHTLDLALHISGATAFDVLECSRVMDAGVDRKVSTRVRLHCAAARAGAIDLDYVVSWLDRQENRLCLGFEHATVWSGLAPDAAVYAGDPRRPAEAIELTCKGPGAVTYNQAFFLEWRSFLDGLQRGEESSISARSALLTSQLVEAILEAP